MLEKQYVIDPGSHELRIYDPKTRTIARLRSCYLKNSPKLTGDRALEGYWEQQGSDLVYPFRQGVIINDPKPLFDPLFAQMPAGRFMFQPGSLLCCAIIPEPAMQRRYVQLLRPYGLAYTRFEQPVCPGRKNLYVHIHAGASQTIISLVDGQKTVRSLLCTHAGIEIDRAIAALIGRRYRSMISAEDARALKEASSRAFAGQRNPKLSCTVLDQKQGYVRLTIPAFELWPCLEETEKRIASSVRTFLASLGLDTLEKALESPVLLTGGLAECFGLKETLEKELCASVEIPENPADVWIRWITES